MIRLSVGPVKQTESWRWIGRDMAGSLSPGYSISFFENFEVSPEADIVFVVKDRPPLDFVSAVQSRQRRLVYAPVDVYTDPAEIAEDGPMLSRCDLVLVHGAELMPAVAAVGARVETVDHHLRYGLDDLAPYRTDGFVLWVGTFGNLPYLLRWLASTPLPYEVRLLTDAFGRDRRAVHFLARRQGVALRFGDDEINGFPAYAWSEARQDEMMRSCRAAIDIKGDNFNQSTKPPTKAQKFIASGIPFACNRESPMTKYFMGRGLDIPVPTDMDRLFSHSYWKETRDAGKILRNDLSFERISALYREKFENLIQR